MKNFLLGVLCVIGVIIWIDYKASQPGPSPSAPSSSPPPAPPAAVTLPSPPAGGQTPPGVPHVTPQPPLVTTSKPPVAGSRPSLADLQAEAGRAKRDLESATSAAIAKLEAASPEYKSLKAKVVTLRAELEQARKGNDSFDKLNASKAYNDARLSLAKMEGDALKADPALAVATRQLRDARMAVSEEEGTVAAEAQRQQAADAERKAKMAAARKPMPEQIGVGDVGLLPAFRVIQVVDGQTMLVSLDSGQNLLVVGGGTSNVADGQHLVLEIPVKVTRTQTYQSLLGQRTVLVAEPYEP